jgi:hypothetical protein
VNWSVHIVSFFFLAGLALLLSGLKGEKKLAGKACLPMLPIQTAPRLGTLCALYKTKICPPKTLFQPRSFSDR